MKLINLFVPFQKINSKYLLTLFVSQLLVIFLLFEFNHSQILPSPLKIFNGVINLLMSSDFWNNLFISFVFILKAMISSMFIALILSYLSQLLFFKQIINIISSFRYLTITGLSTIITILSSDTESIKFNLLMFAIIPFFVSSMLDVIKQTSKQDIELCYTLKKSSWWILKEVIIIGKLAEVFDVMAVNFAICWLMITTVEGKAFNLGGIGTMILNVDKYVKLEEVIPLLILVLFIGISFDYLFRFLKHQIFKYSNLTTI